VSRRPPLYGDLRSWGLVHADALDLLRELPGRSVDCVVTDPPYGLGFGGRRWDGSDIRRAVPGANRLAPGEAFERWTSLWAGELRRVLKPGGFLLAFGSPRTYHRLVCGLEDAGLDIRDTLLWLHAAGVPKGRRLSGDRSTALKPAYEPIAVARAPIEGTTAENLQTWGTGALNIGATRTGRGYWPAHLILSHHEGCSDDECHPACPRPRLDREGDLGRFFYCAKVRRNERDAGCERLPIQHAQIFTGHARAGRTATNIHPTVKPIDVTRWLIRLAAPAGGVVLDPFAGSASIGIGAVLEGRQYLGIEREASYIPVARARLEYWTRLAGERV
jgi:DNA modification methylase